MGYRQLPTDETSVKEYLSIPGDKRENGMQRKKKEGGLKRDGKNREGK